MVVRRWFLGTAPGPAKTSN